jgi:hypothetical protein
MVVSVGRWRKEEKNAAADHTRKVEEAGGVQQTQDPTKPNPSKNLCAAAEWVD